MILRYQRQYSRSIRIVTFRKIVVDEISTETLVGEEEEKINYGVAREMASFMWRAKLGIWEIESQITSLLEYIF